MKITKHVRKHAAKQAISKKPPLVEEMAEKSKELLDAEAEACATV